MNMKSPRNKNFTPDQTDLMIFNQLIPQDFTEFVGQFTVCNNLLIFIDSSIQRDESLDHVLLYGPPGLGKTTLAHLISHKLGAKFYGTSGPVIGKAGDLAGILTSISDRSILFIDEIHRLNRQVEEILYSALDRFVLDIIIGEGTAARSVKVPLPRFTLIGATTRLGLLTKPLRDRFGIQCRLDYYSVIDLHHIIVKAANKMHLSITEQAGVELAKHSRGTPRIAIRLLRRILDFVTIMQKNHTSSHKTVDVDILKKVLRDMHIYDLGLDSLDVSYLSCIANKFDGGPVGLNTIAGAVSETEDSICEIVEPYLLQQGLIQKTPKGRVVTPYGNTYLKNIDKMI